MENSTFNNSTFGYSLFNRHANMDGETLREIGDILMEVRWDSSFDLVNELYGLYDGYLYSDLLINAEILPDDLLARALTSESFKLIELVAVWRSSSSTDSLCPPQVTLPANEIGLPLGTKDMIDFFSYIDLFMF